MLRTTVPVGITELEEAIESAREEYANAKKSGINCYGAGYALGELETLRRIRNGDYCPSRSEEP